MAINRDDPTGPSTLEVAVALTDHRFLTPAHVAEAAAGLIPKNEGWPLRHLQFGNEFCERLLPSPHLLDEAREAAEKLGLRISLATPMVAEDGLARVRTLLSHLPDGAEVIVNDWGIARLIRDDFPDLEPVAGRQLCKMIKDPRLPSRAWTALSPPGLQAPLFHDLLQGLGIRRVEIDVPPLARAEDLRADGLRVSAHAPYGFAAKGRVCKIGSLHQAVTDKFRPDRPCRKECLHFFARLDRGAPRVADEPHMFQRGNTLFYRHTPAMTEALFGAVRQGWIDRIIVAGDWHEDHRTDQLS